MNPATGLTAISSALPAATERAKSDGQPSVGLALGAGSAGAMAEIGVLEILQEAGIRIGCVAGTSAGSVVGAAFASGQLRELRESLESLSRSRTLRLLDFAWPRDGLLHGRRALERIRPHLGSRIEALELPFAAVATDLLSGQEAWLTEGPVFDAVRASSAVPGLFRPWTIGGRPLVDGGLVNPIPVSAARSLGADIIIAVTVEHDAPLASRPSFFSVLMRTSRIFGQQIADYRLGFDRPDILLKIRIPPVGVFDLHRTRELVSVGRRFAESELPAIHAAIEQASARTEGCRVVSQASPEPGATTADSRYRPLRVV